MARRKSRMFTEVELEFMDIIWASGEVTPDDVDKALLQKERKISIGSIRNMLAIMMRKGYITRKKTKGKAYLYSAIIQRDQARRNIIKDLLVNAFDGSESLVIAALLGNGEISEQELKKIRRLIDGYNRRERQ